MRVDGQWYICDDGIVRPVLRGETLASSSNWEPTMFLVDLGADRTVIAADVLPLLDFNAGKPTGKLAGVGGRIDSITIDTKIRLFRDDGKWAIFEGNFAAVIDPDALDMSVLGRDILNLFAVIADRTGDVVTLVRDRHRYKIETA